MLCLDSSSTIVVVLQNVYLEQQIADQITTSSDDQDDVH